MPHITLEISDNIEILKDFSTLFGPLHKILADKLGVNELNCKSRVVRHSEYFIADGRPNQAFAHLVIKTLDRHSQETGKAAGEAAFGLLQEFFEGQTGSFHFQPSVEIHQMKAAGYFKWPIEKIFPEKSNG